MNSEPSTNISKQPSTQPVSRELPRSFVWRMIFGDRIAVFGWLFATIGMLVTLIFLQDIELAPPDLDQRTTATVTHIEMTGSSVNRQPIYSVHYTFADSAGREHRGESFTPSPPSEGITREVDYQASDPAQSQLVGTTRTAFPRWLLPLLLLFPAIGLTLAGWRIRGSLRHLRLLRNGLPTVGKLVEKRETMVSVNNSPVMALTFQYHVGGDRYTATVKTLVTHALEDDPQEPMLYDPHAPANAAPIDHLPGGPKLTPTGELVIEPRFALHLLVLPVVFAGLVIAAVVLKLG